MVVYGVYLDRLHDQAQAYPPQPNFDPPQLIQLRKPIGECTIGVLTSYGAQLKDDHPIG